MLWDTSPWVQSLNIVANKFNDFLKLHSYRSFRIVEIHDSTWLLHYFCTWLLLMLKLAFISMIENVKNSTWHETKHFNTLSHLLRKSNENLNRKRIFQNMNQLYWLCNLMHILVSNVVFILAINPVQLVLLIVHMINRISRIKIVVHEAVIV